MGRFLGQFPQALGDVQKRAAVVICRLPDSPLALNRWLPIRADHLVQTMKLGIDLIFLDELPLLLESLKVQIALPSILFVHDQQCIQALDLYPPLLEFVFRSTDRRAFTVEAAVRLVPSIRERMVYQHLRHPLCSRIVSMSQGVFCLKH